MAKKRKLSVDIVIPVYNEEEDLKKGIMRLHSLLMVHGQSLIWNITIVDNASLDLTPAIGFKLSQTYAHVNFVRITQKGRGRAVKYAWLRSTADILAYMDIDLSTDLKHFLPLVRALTKGFDIAIGSRNAKGAHVHGRNLLRTITSKIYMILIKSFFFVHFSDAQCGFKAMTRSAAQRLLPIVSDVGWFFDSEALIIAEKSGFRIYEEPVTWIDNPGSTVRVWKTAVGDLMGLWRLFITRPWR